MSIEYKNADADTMRLANEVMQGDYPEVDTGDTIPADFVDVDENTGEVIEEAENA